MHSRRVFVVPTMTNTKLSISFIAIGLICCAMCENSSEIVCPRVVGRGEWNASDSTEINFLELPVKIAIICHTASPECWSLDTCKRRVKSFQRYHQREKHFGDIAYKYVEKDI